MSKLLRPSFLISGLLFLGACPHTTPNETGIYSTRTQVMIAEPNGDATPLAEGQRLQSGQIFAVTLELSYPAHVYVIHRRGGTLSDLYPGLGVPDRELPTGIVRLPNSDSWMRVPALDRQSQLCVLLSSDVVDSQLRRCTLSNQPPRPGHSRIQTFVLHH
jgi:hypothetical protein